MSDHPKASLSVDAHTFGREIADWVTMRLWGDSRYAVSRYTSRIGWLRMEAPCNAIEGGLGDTVRLWVASGFRLIRGVERPHSQLDSQNQHPQNPQQQSTSKPITDKTNEPTSSSRTQYRDAILLRPIPPSRSLRDPSSHRLRLRIQFQH